MKIFRTLIISFIMFFCAVLTPLAAAQCLVLGQSYTATVDLRSGNKTKTVVAGKSIQGTPGNQSFDPDCAGRCGAGCGSDNGQGNYAMDCLTHDVCTFYDKKYGGIFDRDCGDEFRAAVDDTVTVGQSACFVSEEEYAQWEND
jgi:hypothetical protein